MTHFVTLTLSPEQIDRYDDKAIVKKTSQWLDNQVKRHALRYVLVPERHQDGAVHWHGLMDLSGVQLVNSGTISGIYDKPARAATAAQRAEWLARGGHEVYNIPGWSLGYSTAIPLWGEYRAAVSYCCKYIGKSVNGLDAADKIGGRWYYSGGALEKPLIVYDVAEIDEVIRMQDTEYTFNIEGTHLFLSMMTIQGGKPNGTE